MTISEAIISDMQAKWPKMTPDKLAEVKAIVEARCAEHAFLVPQECGEKAKRAPKRNILVDAIVEACGGDPLKTTQMAFRTAGTALADIRSVEPDLTPEELFKRARRYRNKFPGITLTPTALCKFWGELAEGQPKRTTAEVTRIHNTPPDGWFDWLCANIPDEDATEYGQVCAARNMKNFGYLPESYRARCRQACGSAQTIGELV